MFPDLDALQARFELRRSRLCLLEHHLGPEGVSLFDLLSEGREGVDRLEELFLFELGESGGFLHVKNCVK